MHAIQNQGELSERQLGLPTVYVRTSKYAVNHLLESPSDCCAGLYCLKTMDNNLLSSSLIFNLTSPPPVTHPTIILGMNSDLEKVSNQEITVLTCLPCNL